MKKNLVSIMILALMVVNVILTAIVMFSVMPSVKKTGTLVNNIATVLNIELSDKSPEDEENKPVAIADSMPVDLGDPLTITLKKGEGEEKAHYVLLSVTFYLNAKAEDYEAQNGLVETNKSLLKGIIFDVVGSHTMAEIQSDTEALKAEILAKVQDEFKSNCIYRIAFSSIMYQ